MKRAAKHRPFELAIWLWLMDAACELKPYWLRSRVWNWTLRRAEECVDWSGVDG